jgi:RHS repeat-associated protein
VTNSTTNIFQVISNVAILAGVTNKTSGGVLVPRASQNFKYDADGNLTNDGVFTYVWDYDNRLVLITNNGVVGKSAQNISMTYDAMGRRASYTVQTNSGATLVTNKAVRYVYDGWNLVAEVNATNQAVINTFLWGNDLSGSLQGAGGVGGLLVVSNSAEGSQLVSFDGNGNVAALLKATNGTISAQYEYGPFGEVVRASGALAAANPFRFSTRIQDEETGSLYYGFRYYLPAVGIWLSRDLVGERGGYNLYAFVQNAPLTKIDLLGLAGISHNDPPTGIALAGSSLSSRYDSPSFSFQWHHPIPYNNSTYDHSSHPLVKRSCLDLKSDQKLIALENHSGRHTASYHEEIRLRLTVKWEQIGELATKEAAQRAVHEVVDGVIEDIQSGKLKLFLEKEVIEVPPQIAFKNPDSYGFVRRQLSASKRLIAEAYGKTLIVVNIAEHVRAIVFIFHGGCSTIPLKIFLLIWMMVPYTTATDITSAKAYHR